MTAAAWLHSGRGAWTRVGLTRADALGRPRGVAYSAAQVCDDLARGMASADLDANAEMRAAFEQFTLPGGV